MDTIIDKEKGTITIVIDEPLNAQHLGNLQTKIDGLTIGFGTTVILDCTGMDYICSSGLRIFLSFQKRMSSVDAKLIIRGLQPLVKQVFDMTGFTNIFTFEE